MTDLTLVLGNKNYSSWSLRPWLAFKKAGIPFDEIMVWLDQQDTRETLKKHSGAARVPVLKTPDGIIWDSLSICEWAAEQHPTLWPEDGYARSQARSYAAEMHSGFQTLRAMLPMNLRAEGRSVEPTEDLTADIQRIDEIWTTCRTTFGADGPWLFGQFSIADAMFAPVVLRFRTYGVEGSGESAAYINTLWNDPDFEIWKQAALTERPLERIDAIGA